MISCKIAVFLVTMNIADFVIYILVILGLNTIDVTARHIIDIADIYPEVKNNLTKVTWVYTINSRELLENALKSDAMMLEADVTLGQLGGESPIIPIMAHPPKNVSDLSLQQFLEKVQEYNDKVNDARKKGVKLDFKSIETMEASVAIVNHFYEKIDYPFWLNANILPGPFNNQQKPVDAAIFFKIARQYPNAILSLGWTTNSQDVIDEVSYTNEQIDEMLSAIRKNNVTQLITFTVRPKTAAQSREQLARLLRNVKGSTLTLWNGKWDTVNTELLRELVAVIGINRVYFGFPDAVSNKLRLDDLTPVRSS